jgi:hypothetical protein
MVYVLWPVCHATLGYAQEKPDGKGDKPIVGLVPKAVEGLKLDGKLDEWDAAFVTPIHVGNPDVVDRLAHVLFLWDDENLYLGLRCLDRKPNHNGPDNQVWNGDSVELCIDTRRGENFAGPEYRPGSLRLFWTPFTGSDIKPRLQLPENLPEALKKVKLQGAEVFAQTTPWGYTAEFKLPWAENFPAFTADVGEVIGLDCALSSSDGGNRIDRAFVYSSPAAAASPAALGRVRLVDKLNPKDLEPLGRALLPLSLLKSANYDWLYGVVGVSPTIENGIEKGVEKLEGRIVDRSGKTVKTAQFRKRSIEGVEAPEFALWWQRFDLSEVPAGEYVFELTARDGDDNVITQRRQKLLHDTSTGGLSNGALPRAKDDKSPSKADDEPPPPKKKEDEPPPSKEKPASKEEDDEPPPKKPAKPSLVKEGSKESKRPTSSDAKPGDEKPTMRSLIRTTCPSPRSERGTTSRIETIRPSRKKNSGVPRLFAPSRRFARPPTE